MDGIRSTRRLSVALGATALAGSISLVAEEASAIIGRPLTPMSYAGVARRTTRRSVYAGAAYGGYRYGGYGYGGYAYRPYGAYAYGAGVAAGAAAAATVAALPAGCPYLGAYYSCGGRYYRPVYDGPNVVYVVTTSP